MTFGDKFCLRNAFVGQGLNGHLLTSNDQKWVNKLKLNWYWPDFTLI